MAAIRGKYLRMLVKAFDNTKADNARSNGTVYYVDGNFGVDTNDGLSWDTPYKTLAVAFAASHTDIASGSNRWARRNTIYIAGDWFVETLIVLPQKTDVIGVGSADGRKGAGITGNHAPVNTAIGTRFYNITFQSTSAAALMTLTSACTAVEFIDCVFDANGAATATGAIDATASSFLKIRGCEFHGAFTGDVIDIGAGSADSMVIKDNIIMGGADNGIVFTATPTVTGGRYMLIANNIIKVADKVIDDGSDDVCFVVDNRCQSDENAGALAYVINDDWGVNNIICCADEVIMIPQLSNVVS